jgi:hypothetical protein
MAPEPVGTNSEIMGGAEITLIVFQKEIISIVISVGRSLSEGIESHGGEADFFRVKPKNEVIFKI